MLWCTILDFFNYQRPRLSKFTFINELLLNTHFSYILRVGSICSPFEHPPYYKCSCPEGFTGNGTKCHDIDEVTYKNYFPSNVQWRIHKIKTYLFLVWLVWALRSTCSLFQLISWFRVWFLSVWLWWSSCIWVSIGCIWSYLPTTTLHWHWRVSWGYCQLSAKFPLCQHRRLIWVPMSARFCAELNIWLFCRCWHVSWWYNLRWKCCVSTGWRTLVLVQM